MSNVRDYYNVLDTALCELRERIESENIQSHNELSDIIHEVADSNVPLYRAAVLYVMASPGIALDFSDSSIMPDTTDVILILQSRIYEQLCIDLCEVAQDYVDEYVASLYECSEEEEE